MHTFLDVGETFCITVLVVNYGISNTIVLELPLFTTNTAIVLEIPQFTTKTAICNGIPCGLLSTLLA